MKSLNVTVGKNHVVNAKLKPEVVIDQIVVTGFKKRKEREFHRFVGQDFGRRRRHRGRHGREPYARRTGGRRYRYRTFRAPSVAPPKVRIRGVTSLSGENKPLWVVDGVVLEDVVNISNDQLSSGDPTTLLGSSVAGINASDIEDLRHPERRLGNGPLRCPRHERRGGHHY